MHISTYLVPVVPVTGNNKYIKLAYPYVLRITYFWYAFD